MKKLCAVLLAAALTAGTAHAQRFEREMKGKHQGMSKDERQRMREEMRELYRGQGGPEHRRHERPRQMSPEEREQLRRDIQDANKDLKR